MESQQTLVRRGEELGVPVNNHSGGGAPDSLPVMRNVELPFHYPPALYAQKVQGNVTLRLYIDSLGVVRPESTMVAARASPRRESGAALK